MNIHERICPVRERVGEPGNFGADGRAGYGGGRTASPRPDGRRRRTSAGPGRFNSGAPTRTRVRKGWRAPANRWRSRCCGGAGWRSTRRRRSDWLSRPSGDPAALLKLAKRLINAKRFSGSSTSEAGPPGSGARVFRPSTWKSTRRARCPRTRTRPCCEWRLNRTLKSLEQVEATARRGIPRPWDWRAQSTRKWEVDGRRANLERSLFFYLRGYAQGAPPRSAGRRDRVLLGARPEAVLCAEQDQGYNGINAAFVLDTARRTGRRGSRACRTFLERRRETP